MEVQPKNTWVKVPGFKTRVADDPLYEADDVASLNPNGRGDTDRSDVKRSSLLTQKRIMTVGCWNVRTLLTTGALEVLLNELEKFRWDVMGISETHWTGVDDFRLKGCRIISSGQERTHRSGVALILGPLAQAAFIGCNPVNDRILTARFQALTGCVICQVYAPTAEASDTDIEAFYGELQRVISSTP